MFAWAEFHLSRMTLSSRSGVGEATVRNASDARRRHRRCRRATPTQNPSDSWVGASLPHSEPRTGASAPLHSYQVWPPGGSNAGSSNLRYRQRPILIKTYASPFVWTPDLQWSHFRFCYVRCRHKSIQAYHIETAPIQIWKIRSNVYFSRNRL